MQEDCHPFQRMFDTRACPMVNGFLTISIFEDHGRADWLGYWDEFVEIARFKKLACLCHIKQNNLTYLGRVCTPCLSGIYGILYRSWQTQTTIIDIHTLSKTLDQCFSTFFNLFQVAEPFKNYWVFGGTYILKIVLIWGFSGNPIKKWQNL